MSNSSRLDHSPFLVQPKKRFRLADHDPGFTSGFENKAAAKEALLQDVSSLSSAQDRLWANQDIGLIIIFQALDAAGKDSTIKHVMSGVNPQGVQVHSFKAPTAEELLHPFLWRPAKAQPARGQIAIFNRSYYEEVLVVRVHPELLQNQRLPEKLQDEKLDKVWKSRFDDINHFERVWRQHNIHIIKFFLNVSREEQRKRFLRRLEDPRKHWKFSSSDVREREFWDDYQVAYQEMIKATSTDIAPWYVIPADKKWFMRACVADIIAKHIEELNLDYPSVTETQQQALQSAKEKLEQEEKPD